MTKEKLLQLRAELEVKACGVIPAEELEAVEIRVAEYKGSLISELEARYLVVDEEAKAKLAFIDELLAMEEAEPEVHAEPVVEAAPIIEEVIAPVQEVLPIEEPVAEEPVQEERVGLQL